MTRYDSVIYISHGISKRPGLSDPSRSPRGADEDADARESKDAKDGPEGKKKEGALDAYCVNLNRKARDGRIDPLIGREAEVQRTMGFENEKDHPEVAPSQFEINYSYSEVVNAADQIQLYKLICRQVAKQMGMTACFLPKPIVGVNGSGMHTNVSVSQKGKNLFWDADGEEKMSSRGWEFIDRILSHGNDISLVMNPSVNAYRRLDPHFEAPNQIKASAKDRGSMVRVPIGNSKSARVEVRSVAPDASPYMVLYSVFKTGLEGGILPHDNLRGAERYLPDNIYDALDNFNKAEWTTKLFGDDVKARYVDLKRASADRCPRLLGTFVKAPEVQYHHEIYNQYLWNMF